MTKSARFLSSRLTLYCLLLLLLLGFGLYIASIIGFDSSKVVEAGKSRWVMLVLFRELPLLLGIALVFSMFYVTGFTLRESSYLKGARGIPFAELMPVYVGFALFLSLLILVFSVFIRPGVDMEMQALRIKTDFTTFSGGKTAVPKLFQDGVRLYYRVEFKKSLDTFNRFLVNAPYNRLAREYRDKAQEELAKLVAFQRAERVRSLIFQQALEHYRGGRFYKAITLFQRILDVRPRHVWAKRFLKLSREALKKDGRSVDAEAALKRRVAAFLRQGIDAYARKQYWEAWRTMRDVLMLSPFDVTAEEYLKKAREKIVGFDFFPEEVRDLKEYPARRAVFLPIGGERYVFASWFVRKRTQFYLLDSWVVELDGNGAVKRAIHGKSGKWIGAALVLKEAQVVTPRSNGLPLAAETARISIPGSVLPEVLWDASVLMQGRGHLDPVAIINLVSYFSSSRITLLHLKLAFTEVFALPLMAFCLSLLVVGRAWKNRHMSVALDKRFVLPVFAIFPFFVYFLLTAGVRLLLGIERAGVALSPLFSYLLPILAGLLGVIGSFSAFYRNARMRV